MKLTIIQVGQTPEHMVERYTRFPPQYQDLLLQRGEEFSFETIYIIDGEEFPDISKIEGMIITGSAYSVYDAPDWIDPLCNFICKTYEAKIPTVGICFGHQAMALALGGKVAKSDKGWGIGRHIYEVTKKPKFLNGVGDKVAIAASHQDQVIIPPKESEVFLASDFTPNAGLLYKNGAAISLQPHPEFKANYAIDLIDRLRDGRLSEAEAKAAENSLKIPLDSLEIGAGLARFFKGVKK